MKQLALLAVALLSLSSLGLSGCGDVDAPSTGGGGATGVNPAASRSPFANIKISHILIAMESRREPKLKRTKEQCLEIANSLLADVKGGRDFLEAAGRFSDDFNPQTGKPNTNCNEPGSYQGTVIDSFVKPFQDAVLATPVGTVFPTPIYADPFGYFIIRRVK